MNCMRSVTAHERARTLDYGTRRAHRFEARLTRKQKRPTVSLARSSAAEYLRLAASQEVSG